MKNQNDEYITTANEGGISPGPVYDHLPEKIDHCLKKELFKTLLNILCPILAYFKKIEALIKLRKMRLRKKLIDVQLGNYSTRPYSLDLQLLDADQGPNYFFQNELSTNSALEADVGHRPSRIYCLQPIKLQVYSKT